MHSKMKSRAALVLGLVSATMLAACGQSDGDSSAKGGCDKNYTIGFSHPVSEAAGPKALKRIITKYAKEKGCIKVLFDNTTASNLESQRSTIESWVTQGVDSILLFPVDASAFTNLQKQAQAKGIKWLSYAGHLDGEDGSVGFDSDQAGTLIADDVSTWIKKRYPDGKFSAAVATYKALPSLGGRWEKPEAAVKALNVPIVSTADCADQTCGLQIAEDALREHSDLRVFIGVNDDAALGAQKAFENAGLSADDVYISGSDGTPEALDNIKTPGKGAFRASAALDIESLGHDILDNSLAAITGKGKTDSETPAILAKTGDDKQLDELLKQFK